ncbi:hypothetical protein [Desertivirga brevis]|uniref:hypothetical protein n=1 Tax=Desertivirga brevis TaxID=2810310 RepID=UPI001A974CD3|nr:hypothetical protein [Pedobacter sp. SYSU D00873]
MRFLFLLFTVSTLTAFSQSNYKPGYVILNNKDTIKGLVDTKEWGLTPKSILFKTKEGKKVYYSPKHIQSFHVPGFCKYVTYNGPISKNENEFTKVGATIDTTAKVDTVFLREIVHGEYLSLFDYKDNLKQRFFVKDKFSKIEELLSYKYRHNNSLLSFEAYRERLKTLVSEAGLNNPAFPPAIDNSSYSKASFLKLFMFINGITTNHTEEKREAIEIFFGISANQTTFEFEEVHPLSGSENNSKTYILPGIELGLVFYPSSQIRKLAIRTTFGISKHQFETYKDEELSAGRISRATYELDVLNLAFTPTIQYNIYNGKLVKGFINTGIAINTSLKEKSEFKKKMIKSPVRLEIDQSYYNENYNFPSFWIQFPIECGIQISKVQILARYLQPLGSNIEAKNNNMIKQHTLSGAIRYHL